MSDRYLWDPNQEPDPEVQELERALRNFAYKPDWDTLDEQLHASKRQVPNYWRLGLAASLLIALAGTLVWWRGVAAEGWRIASVHGSVRVGSRPVSTSGELRQGQELETLSSGHAQLEIGTIGNVEVLPASRVRLLNSSVKEQRLWLERGSIRAMITAPPRLFVVSTPAAMAVDLGCAYKLDVDDTGGGYLRVTVGWVSFEAQGRESFIPAGAACRTRKGYAPGTPFYQDASDGLQRALETVDFSAIAQERSDARGVVLGEARARDRLTLWHLLSRGTESERAATYDRFAQLGALPQGVTREGTIRLDPVMLDKMWASLELGPTAWWRTWKGPLPPSP